MGRLRDWFNGGPSSGAVAEPSLPPSYAPGKWEGKIGELPPVGEPFESATSMRGERRYKTRYTIGSPEVPAGFRTCVSRLMMAGVRVKADDIQLLHGSTVERDRRWVARGWVPGNDTTMLAGKGKATISVFFVYWSAKKEFSLSLAVVDWSSRINEDLFSAHGDVYTDPMDWSVAFDAIRQLGEYVNEHAVEVE